MAYSGATSSLATQALELESLRDSSICGKCRATDANYLDPKSRLAWARICRHALCERCRQELFGRHRSNRCPVPQCGDTVTQTDYVLETREQVEFKKECDVRRRLSRIFNRQPSDFRGDTAAYNDYLEMAERYIATLVTGTPEEIARVEAAISAYKDENARSIAANEAAQSSAAQRQAAMAKVDAVVRAEHAVKTAQEETARRAATDAMRARLFTLLSTIRDAGSGLTPAKRDAYRTELASLKLQLTQAQGAAGSTAKTPAGATGAPDVQHAMVVPCASIFPPKLLAEVNAALAALAPAATPAALLERQLRASGDTAAERDGWLSGALEEELWFAGCAGPGRPAAAS